MGGCFSPPGSALEISFQSEVWSRVDDVTRVTEGLCQQTAGIQTSKANYLFTNGRVSRGFRDSYNWRGE